MNFILRTPEIKQRCLNEVKSLNLNTLWQVEICPYKKNKTRQQEKYWHKLLQLLADNNGTTKQYEKMLCKYAILPLDEIMIKGVRHLYPVSSSGITTKQYNELIDKTLIDCAGLGIVTPTPDYYGMEV